MREATGVHCIPLRPGTSLQGEPTPSSWVTGRGSERGGSHAKNGPLSMEGDPVLPRWDARTRCRTRPMNATRGRFPGVS